MSRLTAAVMTHPGRAETAAALVAGAPPGLLDVVVDPEPGGPPTALRTTLRAWSSVPPGSTHHLVLQDDVVLADGFYEHAARAAAAFPDAALAFFTNWNSRNGAAVRLGALTGAGWVGAASEYTPTPALLLPAEVAAGYAAFARGQACGWSEDVIMHRYLRARSVPTYLAVPNPVEHEELPSLIGNDGHGLRRSACFGPPGRDSLLAAPPAIPFFKRGRAYCAVRMSATAWETVTGERFLARAGVSPEHCAEGFERALSSLALPLDRAVLWQAWLAACSLGVAVRDLGTGAPRDDIADRALATLGPGGLCDACPGPVLRDLAAGLASLARLGVETGRHADRARPRAAARAGRVVVTRGRGVLAEHVARELADRGHRVVSCGPEPLLDAYTDVEHGAVIRYADTVVHLAGLDEAYGRGRGTVTQVLVQGATRTHVLRLGTAYGPGVATGTVIARFVDRTLRGLPAERAGVCRPMHVTDLAAAIDHVLTVHPRRTVLEVAGPPTTAERLGDLADYAQWLAYDA